MECAPARGCRSPDRVGIVGADGGDDARFAQRILGDGSCDGPAPNADGARAVVQRRLGRFKLPAKTWAAAASHAVGLSQAELVRATDTVVKRAILDGSKTITDETLSAALEDRQAFNGRFRLPA